MTPWSVACQAPLFMEFSNHALVNLNFFFISSLLPGALGTPLEKDGESCGSYGGSRLKAYRGF